MIKLPLAARLLRVLLPVFLFSGCSTLVTYHPQTSGPTQTLRYAQGVGTLSIKDNDQEIFMYPAFKTQGPSQPTFIIGYANNAATSENFSPDNIKVYFRGSPVSIYTYTEKIEEIRNEKLGQQVALAILGGVTAVAAARNASKQTYTSNYSGSVWGRGGQTGFAGSSTLRVYDPGAGMLAGAAVGAVTGVGIAQLEFNARNQEQAAEAILQANTVDPQRLVTGVLILKNCCDKFPSGADDIRFEVLANGKASIFQFHRTIGSGGTVPQQAVVVTSVRAAPVANIGSGTVTTPAASQAVPVTPAPPTPIKETGIEPRQAAPASVTVAPTAASLVAPVPPAPALKGGQDEYQVQRLAKLETCNLSPSPKLTAKGPGFETYVVTCTNGDVVSYRCEFGNCRALK